MLRGERQLTGAAVVRWDTVHWCDYHGMVGGRFGFLTEVIVDL